MLALEVGAALGMSGAVLQGVTRNPLAEPGLLGVSAGAALGAVIAVYFGFATHFTTAAPLLGLLGALLASVVTFALGRGGGTTARRHAAQTHVPGRVVSVVWRRTSTGLSGRGRARG